MKMNTNTLLIMLMGVLVVMAALQAFQLVTLAQAVSSGAVTTGSGTGGVLSNLPSQVGGCG